MRPLRSQALAAMVDAAAAAAAESAADAATDDDGRGAPPAMRMRMAQPPRSLRGAGAPAASSGEPGDPRDPQSSVAEVLRARPWLSAVPPRRRAVRRRALVVVDARGALLGRLEADGDAVDVELQTCAILDAADFRAAV